MPEVIALAINKAGQIIFSSWGILNLLLIYHSKLQKSSPGAVEPNPCSPGSAQGSSSCVCCSQQLPACLGELGRAPAQVGTSSPLLCVVFFVIVSELKTSFRMAFKSDSCNSCHSFKSTNFVRTAFLKVGSGLESFSIVLHVATENKSFPSGLMSAKPDWPEVCTWSTDRNLT